MYHNINITKKKEIFLGCETLKDLVKLQYAALLGMSAGWL